MITRTSGIRQLPATPKTEDKHLNDFNESVKQILEMYQGNVGNPLGLDRVVRVKDIVSLDPSTFLSNMQRRSFTSRITRITGNIIRLGRIESNDSTTYFDLDNNKFVMNSKINYASAMPGLFMGKDDDGIYKFNMGHATNGEVKFNGTNVYLNKWVITENGIGNSANENTSTIVLDGTNKKIRVGPSTGYIDIDGDNKMIQSSDYSSGAMGSGFHLSAALLETGNIACRGIFRTSVFQKLTVSAIGGNLLVRPADVLDTDMTAADDSTVKIEGNETFAVGDILRAKSATDDEWMEVTDASGAPTYVVTRDKAGDYASGDNPVWTKGQAIVSYGQSGDGGIYMTSSDTGAPFVSVYTHAGSPWSSLSTMLRYGNLNGYAGYVTDTYGLASYIDADNYFKLDPVNGLQLSGNVVITGGSVPGLTLDDLADGEIYGKVNITAISAGNILLASCSGDLGDISGTLDDIANGALYGKVNLTSISGGNILLASCSGDLGDISGTLDDIADGTTYGRVATTSISGGKIIMTSGAGVFGILPTANTAAKCTDANADQTSANSQDLSWLIGTSGSLTISSGGKITLSTTDALEISGSGNINVLSGGMTTFQNGSDISMYAGSFIKFSGSTSTLNYKYGRIMYHDSALNIEYLDPWAIGSPPDLYLGRFYAYASSFGDVNVQANDLISLAVGTYSSNRSVRFSGLSLYPQTDNSLNLGALGFGWKNLYVSGIGRIDGIAYVGGINSTGDCDPSSNNSYDLGSSSYKWKDLYLSGKAYVGSLSCSGACSPSGSYDLGSSSYKWKDLYLSGKAYFNGTSCLIQYDSGTVQITNGSGYLWVGSTVFTNITVRPQTAKGSNLGISGNQIWDNVYADDFVNECWWLDDVDDLALISAIQPARDGKGNLIYKEGYPRIDYNTLPDFVRMNYKYQHWTKKQITERFKGEGAPGLGSGYSIGKMLDLALGGIRQQKRDFDELKKEVNDLKDKIAA